MAQYKRRDPLVWGIILIGLGLIFLLANVDFDIWGFIARLWPLILIVWGAWKFYFGLKRREEEEEEEFEKE